MVIPAASVDKTQVHPPVRRVRRQYPAVPGVAEGIAIPGACPGGIIPKLIEDVKLKTKQRRRALIRGSD